MNSGPSPAETLMVGRPLNVLHVVLSVGATNATYNEHCLAAADTRNVTLCTYFKPAVQVPPTIRVFEGNGSVRGFYRALGAALRGHAYDVIHAHSPHVALMLLLSALRYRDLPPFVVTVHDSYPNYRVRNRLLWLPVFAAFRAVVCCSHSSFESFPRVYRWLAGQRLRTVPNGVDIHRVDRILATCDDARDPDQFTVVAVSRLVAIKNPFVLLKVFSEVASPTSRLAYIGDGPLRESLRTWCSAAGLGHRVTFTGLLPRNRVYERLHAADLFVSTSRGEGLPVAVLEAMACGCPVVLSDIPPHREIAGEFSWIPLVDPDDIAGFVHAIETVRQMSDADRRRIGRACRSVVERQFSVEGMHAGYTAIYAEVARRGRPAARRPEAAYH